MWWFFLSFFLATASTNREVASEIRYQISSLQAELIQAKARIESQEAVIEALRQEMEKHLNINKELIKGSVTSAETKVGGIEKASQDLAEDLIKLKAGTQSALKELDTHLSKLEKEQATLGKNLKHLETAIGAVLEALGGGKGELALASSDKTHTVKDGESLGEIAKKYNTSVKALKEFNQLTKDTIRIGQKIAIP